MNAIQAADLVSLTEIAIRAGVTNAAVANWHTRHHDFPEPVRVLACGPIFTWPQIAAWLTRHDMPNATQTEAKRPGLSKDKVSFAVCQARNTPSTFWADLAKECGISRRHLQLLVQADAIGEDFGWFTKQRRAK